jgi:hypothetical protein
MSLTNAKLVSMKDQLAADEVALKAELDAVEKAKSRAGKEVKKEKKY